jgi:hypothetical protein
MSKYNEIKKTEEESARPQTGVRCKKIEQEVTTGMWVGEIAKAVSLYDVLSCSLFTLLSRSLDESATCVSLRKRRVKQNKTGKHHRRSLFTHFSLPTPEK